MGKQIKCKGVKRRLRPLMAVKRLLAILWRFVTGPWRFIKRKWKVIFAIFGILMIVSMWVILLFDLDIDPFLEWIGNAFRWIKSWFSGEEYTPRLPLRRSSNFPVD